MGGENVQELAPSEIMTCLAVPASVYQKVAQEAVALGAQPLCQLYSILKSIYRIERQYTRTDGLASFKL